MAAVLAVLLLGPPSSTAAGDEPLLGAVRQLTFEGRVSGKARFSADGHTIIFESAREAGTPSPQVYLLNLGNGELRRVSPGPGPAADGAIHLDSTRALFSATDGGGAKEHFDVYELDLNVGIDVNLTDSAGYDGEATYSPNGRLIVFVSNRHAHAGRLAEAEVPEFKRQPSTLNDIYVMGSDGAGARRLTRTLGQDGMPAFSADGRKIVWRRVARDGASSEIFTMNADGTGERQITRLGGRVSAPTFHPSGDYIVFSAPAPEGDGTELYIVDAEGRRHPVRVTRSDGRDGEPAFTRLGDALAWTSQRTSGGVAQIFFARWDDDGARRLLALDDDKRRPGAPALLAMTRPGFSDLDARLHVGRLAASATESAVAYVASVFGELGLEPAGDGGTYVQDFTATVGTAIAAGSRLALLEPGGASDPVGDRDWRPLAFSGTGFIRPAPLVFAGWGLVTPAEGGALRFDSYGELEVGGMWVLVLPGLPANVEPEHASYLARYASLRHKAAEARQRGALGIVVVSPPTAGRGEGLIGFWPQSMLAADTAALTIADALATRLLRHAGKDLGALRAALERGEPVAGFPIAGVTLGGSIVLTQEQRTGQNVLGRLGRESPGPTPAIVVGASLMPGDPGSRGIARGRRASFAAEDAASGVAGLIEIAQHFSRLHGEDGLEARRDIVFAVWGGAPGTIGATHFAEAPTRAAAAGAAAYLHLDMIGRLGARMPLQGTRSSADWAREIERANAPVALPVVTEGGGFLPGAATVFFQREVPVLNAFTGAAYHRDRADAGLLYSGVARVARLMANITLSAARRGTAPAYVRNDPQTTEPRRRFLLAALPPDEREAMDAPMPRPTGQATVELAALPAPPPMPAPSEPAATVTATMRVEAPPKKAAAVEETTLTHAAEPIAPPPLPVDPPIAKATETTPPASPPVEASTPLENPMPASVAPPEEIAAVKEPTPTRPAEPVAPPPPTASVPTPPPPLPLDPPIAKEIETTQPVSPPVEASTPPENPMPAPVAPPEEIAAVEEPTPDHPTEPVAPPSPPTASVPTPPPLPVNPPIAKATEPTPSVSPPVEASTPPESPMPAPVAQSVEIAAVEEPTPDHPTEPVAPPPPAASTPTPPPLLAASAPTEATKPTTPVVATPMVEETPPPIRVAARREHARTAGNEARGRRGGEIGRHSKEQGTHGGPGRDRPRPPSASVQEPPAAPEPVAQLLPALGQSGRLGKLLASANGGAGGSCVRKNKGAVVFCIEAIDWPADLEDPFDTSTLMYRGAKAIVRYDDGKATGFHALFHGRDFDAVVSHFEGLLGKPSATPERRIAPMTKPRRANPTRVWRIAGPNDDAVLEVRRFDGARGGFPDTKHGVVLLGRTPVRAIFPQLSSLDLMMIR